MGLAHRLFGGHGLGQRTGHEFQSKTNFLTKSLQRELLAKKRVPPALAYSQETLPVI